MTFNLVNSTISLIVSTIKINVNNYFAPLIVLLYFSRLPILLDLLLRGSPDIINDTNVFLTTEVLKFPHNS